MFGKRKRKNDETPLWWIMLRQWRYWLKIALISVIFASIILGICRYTEVLVGNIFSNIVISDPYPNYYATSTPTPQLTTWF